MPEAYIYDTLRTPRGSAGHGRSLHEVKSLDLLAAVLRQLRQRQALDTSQVDDVIIGCSTPVDDQGYNIAKAALLHAEWSKEVGGFQLNRYAASSLEAVNLAAAKVRSGWGQLVVAGGVESSSRVVPGSDGGALLYDPELINRVRYVPQGVAADLIATLEGFRREMLDQCALQSHQRAYQAQREGYLDRALAPILDRNGLLLLEKDELPHPGLTAEDLTELPPAFESNGREGFDALAIQQYPRLARIEHRHTSGNVAALANGAALALIGSRESGESLSLQPRARILAVGNASVDPTLMLAGAVPAARKALHLAGMKPADVDLWECQENFAAVRLHFQQHMDIEEEYLNVNGGAIAFGKAAGADGATLLGMLLDELERRDLQTGLAALPCAGGMGVATIIERV